MFRHPGAHPTLVTIYNIVFLPNKQWLLYIARKTSKTFIFDVGRYQTRDTIL